VKKLLLVTVLLCLVAQFAYADDYYPPPWRGLPGTTFQQWEFNDSNTAPLPTDQDNPYGTPVTNVVPNGGMTWLQEFGGRPGVWPLSGYIETTIPNTPIPNPTKTIWVSITWMPQGIGCTPFVIETTSATSGELIHQDTVTCWTRSTYEIVMHPNPPFETILIQGDIMVDEMVIDTACVPEPGSLAVLGTGAIGLLFGLRRRR
jgi:hypothetical protein